MMNDFPDFMKHPYNKISARSQYSKNIEGYVFDGADGGQMTIWTCGQDGISQEHAHDFDEYLVVVQGQYTVIMEGKRIPLGAGQEYYIPKGTAHGGEFIAGTRTIHAFGGRRARRAIEEKM